MRAQDWLDWADRAAVQRFPKDMELVARWMLHEALRGNKSVVRTLRIALLSLPAAAAVWRTMPDGVRPARLSLAQWGGVFASTYLSRRPH